MSETLGESPRTYAEFLAQPDIVRVVAELRESPIHSEKGIQLACMTTWANKLEITNQMLRERVAELEEETRTERADRLRLERQQIAEEANDDRLIDERREAARC
jgi:hypothetical protein